MEDKILQSVDQLNINRNDFKYTNRFGIPVPRVTEILSTMIHSDSLIYWSNILGLKGKKYEEELDRAANYGTMVHSYIEKFFKTGENPSNWLISFDAFKRWYDKIISNYNFKLLYSEKELVCDYYGGTCDMVMELNGLNYIVDFKTSNHITFKYMLQLAAYIYMLSLESITINGAVILKLSKTLPEYNEYILNFSNPDHKKYIDSCITTFHQLVSGYYHIKYCEEQYKILNLKGGYDNVC